MLEMQWELLLVLERREKLMKKDNLIFAHWLKYLNAKAEKTNLNREI